MPFVIQCPIFSPFSPIGPHFPPTLEVVHTFSILIWSRFPTSPSVPPISPYFPPFPPIPAQSSPFSSFPPFFQTAKTWFGELVSSVAVSADAWMRVGFVHILHLPVRRYTGSDKVHYIPDPEDPNVLLPLMGTDSHTGEHYHSLSNLWNSDASVKDWEDKNVKYWNERQANVNNPEIAAVDLRESDAFLKPAFPGGQRWTRRGLDLGAGVGRVSQGVLLNYVYTVDLVDTGAHFLREAKRRLSTRNLHGKYIQSSVQDASIDANTYDLVCLQYTALYIPDDELIGVLRKASAGRASLQAASPLPLCGDRLLAPGCGRPSTSVCTVSC